MTAIEYVMMSDEIRVHRAGCADVTRDAKSADALHPFAFEMDVTSQREVIEDAYGDFIFFNEEQPWTDYEMYSRFLPCIASLPREADVS